MDNPFADLQRVREEQEETERKEWQRRQEADQKANQMASQYNEKVKSVLEQLRQAAYPHDRVTEYSLFPESSCSGVNKHSNAEHRYSGAFWWIEMNYEGSGNDSSGGGWRKPAVTVDLVWDSSFQPLHFKVTRSGSYKRQKPVQPLPPPKKSLFGRSNKQPASPQPAEYEDVRYEPLVVELSQEALVKALRQLHPAGSY